MKICDEPFENIEIDESGSAYFCCYANMDKISIGNIYESKIWDVWNSEFAVDFRKSVLDGSYKYCNKKECYKLNNPEDNFVELSINHKPEMEKLPVRVKLMHDYECNVNCIICRKDILRQSDQDLKILNDKAETVFLPMLKDAELVVLNAYGDPFASRNNCYLIKRICETYPDTFFEFHTNGILSSKSKLESLGVLERIFRVVISVHAATKETYDKIVLNGNFDKVMENIRFFSQMKKDYYLDTRRLNVVTLCFVVNALNYKEMQKFIDLAKELDLEVYFWEYRPQGFYTKIYDELAVHEPTHEKYEDFVKTLKSLKFNEQEHNALHPVLEKIRSS